MQTFSNSIARYLLLQKMSWQTIHYIWFWLGTNMQQRKGSQYVIGSLDITWTEDVKTIKIRITETLHGIQLCFSVNYLQVYRIWVEQIKNLLIIYLQKRAFTCKSKFFISPYFLFLQTVAKNSWVTITWHINQNEIVQKATDHRYLPFGF